MTPAIVIEALGKRYGAKAALDAVSCTVPSGCIFGLLGPNGAGKTTLFSILAGFVRADAGGATVLGEPLAGVHRLRGRLGILPQDAQFQADLPIGEQLAYLLRLQGRPAERARAEAIQALERVGLSGELHFGPGALSHGMAKRLGLAQAFLGDPELILLDEPTAGLDPANAAAIRALIRSFHARNATIVVSSHDLAEMQAICSEVCILRKGRVVSVGRIDTLTAADRTLDLQLSRELSAEEQAAVLAVAGVRFLTPQGPAAYRAGIHAGSEDPNGDAATAALLGHLLAIGVVPRRLDPGSSLERHFMAVTK